MNGLVTKANYVGWKSYRFLIALPPPLLLGCYLSAPRSPELPHQGYLGFEPPARFFLPRRFGIRRSDDDIEREARIEVPTVTTGRAAAKPTPVERIRRARESESKERFTGTEPHVERSRPVEKRPNLATRRDAAEMRDSGTGPKEQMQTLRNPGRLPLHAESQTAEIAERRRERGADPERSVLRPEDRKSVV